MAESVRVKPRRPSTDSPSLVTTARYHPRLVPRGCRVPKCAGDHRWAAGRIPHARPASSRPPRWTSDTLVHSARAYREHRVLAGPEMTPADGGFRHRQVEVEGSSIHVVEAGDPDTAPTLLLHGWPESWRSWQPVMELARPMGWVIAIDLPGVGGSTGDATDGTKCALARMVHEVAVAMGLGSFTLVGHDMGGMVAYAYLRSYDDLRGCVIMDVVIPGLEPWEEVLRNPYLWHFAFHGVPDLPERLVQGHQGEYFDFFYDALAADPRSITAEARDAYVQAYTSEEALRAGFNWYRAFGRDATDNRDSGGPAATPVLYLRGEHESGEIGHYVAGLRRSGLTDVRHGVVMGSGHFAPEEAPQETWELIAGS